MSAATQSATEKSGKGGARPEFVARLGGISAAVFSGEYGPSVRLQRRYQKDGAWTSSDFIPTALVPAAIYCMKRALAYLASQEDKS